MGDDWLASWPAGPLARSQYTCDTRVRARPSSRANVSVFAHASIRVLSHACSVTPCTGCWLSAEWQPHGRRRWLYVLTSTVRLIYIYAAHERSLFHSTPDRPRQEANKLFLCRIYPVESGYAVPDPPDVAPNYPVGKHIRHTPSKFVILVVRQSGLNPW